MKHIRSFAVATVLGLTCFAAWAQSNPYSTVQVIKRQAPKGITNAFYACIEKADSNSDHLALALCETDEKKVQDHRLNTAYKAVLTKLNAQDKGSLISAERAWLSFHQTSSHLESALYGRGDVAESESALEVDLSEIFRLCERANTLDTYLRLASHN